jgi:glycosyltransferase involved in cell wall biosynthesis
MQICLFRAFPDSYRQSMRIYADQLLARVGPLLNGTERMYACELPGAHLAPRWRRHWDQYVRYQRYTRSVHGDVNHVIDPGYGHLVWSLPQGRTIATFHDAAVARLGGISAGMRLSFRRNLSAIRRAARVVACSLAARNDFLTLVDYPEDRVSVVPLGLDPAFQVLADREALRHQNGVTRPAVLHVGHTQPNMNVETALRAFATLVARHQVDAQFLKAGNPFTGEQERLIDRLGLRSRVLHFGLVPMARLRDLYNCADALWYPVLCPGFGLPPLEAMACGTPVICSNGGSLPEVAGGAAVMIDPLDDEALARETAALLGDAMTYARVRAAGLARARQYDWNRTAREMLAIYREVGHA